MWVMTMIDCWLDYLRAEIDGYLYCYPIEEVGGYQHVFEDTFNYHYQINRCSSLNNVILTFVQQTNDSSSLWNACITMGSMKISIHH